MGRIWSTKDVASLKKLRRSKKSLKAIAGVLSRTTDAVRIKANRLGYHIG